MTTLQPKPVRLDGSISHDDWLSETLTFPCASAAPPSPQGAGEQSADAIAADGGVSSFPIHESQHWSAWDVVAGQSPMLTDLREFCELLNDSPDLRATAVLRSLERVRRELERCPDDSPLTSSIQLTLQDTVTLARALLQRLR